MRELERSNEKERIGRAAAKLVQAGERVFLGSGTTVEAMAGHLGEVGRLTVITNSLPVVNRLADNLAIDLIVIGGEFRHTERSMISQVAERMIAEFRVDTVYMGVPAIDVVHGLTADSVAEASTDRAIMAIARRRVILADHTKFNRVGTVSLAQLDAVDLIITDQLDDGLAESDPATRPGGGPRRLDVARSDRPCDAATPTNDKGEVIMRGTPDGISAHAPERGRLDRDRRDRRHRHRTGERQR